MTLWLDKPLKCKNIGYKLAQFFEADLKPMFLRFKGLSNRKVVLSNPLASDMV